MIVETSATTANAVCMRRLMQLLPLVARGIKRSQDRSAPETLAPLGPRHLAALEHLRDGPLTVGALAAQLDLTLSTVSGVLADLDRAGYVIRSADAGDRRRTIVRVDPEKQAEIQQWLECSAAPLARVIRQLAPAEQAAFLKVMDLLEAEMRNQDPKH